MTTKPLPQVIPVGTLGSVHAIVAGGRNTLCGAVPNGGRTITGGTIECPSCAKRVTLLLDAQAAALSITAAQLCPGDIVIDPATGERQYAAFDRFVGRDAVTVWTAVADQDRGLPRLLDVEPDAPLTVQRRQVAR